MESHKEDSNNTVGLSHAESENGAPEGIDAPEQSPDGKGEKSQQEQRPISSVQASPVDPGKPPRRGESRTKALISRGLRRIKTAHTIVQLLIYIIGIPAALLAAGLAIVQIKEWLEPLEPTATVKQVTFRCQGTRIDQPLTIEECFEGRLGISATPVFLNNAKFRSVEIQHVDAEVDLLNGIGNVILELSLERPLLIEHVVTHEGEKFELGIWTPFTIEPDQPETREIFLTAQTPENYFTCGKFRDILTTSDNQRRADMAHVRFFAETENGRTNIVNCNAKFTDRHRAHVTGRDRPHRITAACPAVADAGVKPGQDG